MEKEILRDYAMSDWDRERVIDDISNFLELYEDCNTEDFQTYRKYIDSFSYYKLFCSGNLKAVRIMNEIMDEYKERTGISCGVGKWFPDKENKGILARFEQFHNWGLSPLSTYSNPSKCSLKHKARIGYDATLYEINEYVNRLIDALCEMVQRNEFRKTALEYRYEFKNDKEAANEYAKNPDRIISYILNGMGSAVVNKKKAREFFHKMLDEGKIVNEIDPKIIYKRI